MTGNVMRCYSPPNSARFRFALVVVACCLPAFAGCVDSNSPSGANVASEDRVFPEHPTTLPEPPTLPERPAPFPERSAPLPERQTLPKVRWQPRVWSMGGETVFETPRSIIQLADRVKPGMTESEVEAIFGVPPNRLERYANDNRRTWVLLLDDQDSAAGITTLLYDAEFVDGRLTKGALSRPQLLR